MSTQPDIRIVVFDLGGVIVRICRTWEDGCRAAGLSPRDGIDRWEAPPAKERRRELNSLHQRGLIPSTDFYKGIALSAPGVYTADEIRRVHHAWTLDEYPGVGKLIDELHSAGMTTGVLSNTNEAHWARLAPPIDQPATEYPTPRRMHHVHASHLLQLIKPDVTIYHAFVNRTGFRAGAADTAHGSEILFFDDLIENVQSARAAGWLAHQVDHAGDPASEMRSVLREMGVFSIDPP